MIRARQLARQAATAVIAIGVVTMTYAGCVFVEAETYRSTFAPTDAVGSGERRMDIHLAAPAVLSEGADIGELRIERLGISASIAQGESIVVLRRGVGHLADTAWLDRPGNVVLAGHRDTVFRGLKDIRVGDVIDVATTNRQIHYAVRSMIVVAPTNLAVLQDSTENTLTLITCFPFGFFGAAPDRFVVTASEIR